MKLVAGWNAAANVYHSEKRWMPPATDITPRFA